MKLNLPIVSVVAALSKRNDSFDLALSPCFQHLFPLPYMSDSLLCGYLEVDGARGEEFGG